MAIDVVSVFIYDVLWNTFSLDTRHIYFYSKKNSIRPKASPMYLHSPADRGFWHIWYLLDLSLRLRQRTVVQQIVFSLQRRRRRNVALIAAVVALARLRAPDSRDLIRKTTVEFLELTDYVSDGDFKQCLRLPRDAFRSLLHTLRPRLHRLLDTREGGEVSRDVPRRCRRGRMRYPSSNKTRGIFGWWAADRSGTSHWISVQISQPWSISFMRSCMLWTRIQCFISLDFQMRRTTMNRNRERMHLIYLGRILTLFSDAYAQFMGFHFKSRNRRA